MEQRLHTFTEESIRKDCRDLTGYHENGLFYSCDFDNLKGLTLKDCDLNASTFYTDSVRDALGFCLSLSCLSFRNVKYSELLFDMLLTLMTFSAGNDKKREQLKQVVGRDRYEALVRVLKATE